MTSLSTSPQAALMLRRRPEVGLEARTTVTRPSRLGFAEHLRMRTVQRAGGARRFLHQPGEAAAEHLAHHAEIVARHEVLGLHVEGAVMRLHEAGRPRDDHRADRVRAHDVRVVVDLDSARHAFEAEGLA